MLKKQYLMTFNHTQPALLKMINFITICCKHKSSNKEKKQRIKLNEKMDNSYGNILLKQNLKDQINSRWVIGLRKSTKSTEENLLTQCLYLTLQWSGGDQTCLLLTVQLEHAQQLCLLMTKRIWNISTSSDLDRGNGFRKVIELVQNIFRNLSCCLM